MRGTRTKETTPNKSGRRAGRRDILAGALHDVDAIEFLFACELEEITEQK